MLRDRVSNHVRTGFIGVVLAVLVVNVLMQPARLWSWAATLRYQALFSEAGGLSVGDDVTISGTKIGAVSEIGLEGLDVLVKFTINSSVSLGSQTTAHIAISSALGKRALNLESSGTTKLATSDVIPLSQTSSPYSLTDAVSELTTNVSGTDTGALNQSLDAMSAMIDQIAPQLGPTFESLTRMSQSLTARDETIDDLLKHTSDVTEVLAQRSQQLNSLILNANDLLATLSERRQAIAELLVNTSAVAKQLSGLVADNKEKLGPALDKLNSVVAMLEKNRDNIAKLLPGLAKFQNTLGEAVANGPYYSAFVPNILPQPVQLLQPFFDYAFGFRRGNDAGQPPDNAGPRVEFPFPVNGIPQQGGHP